MKAKIILSVLLGYFFASDLFAQIQVPGPDHPLVNYGLIRMNTSIDTIHHYLYYEMGREMTPRPIPGEVFYARSEDKLTDTVTIRVGLERCDVYRYNEKNQLLYIYEYYSRYPLYEYQREDYEYDEKGRLVKIVSKTIRPTKTPSETDVKVYTYDYSTAQMTGKGYIFEGMEYELDDQGRLTYAKVLNGKDEFAEYTDEKKYRIGDFYYTYTDSSYTKLGYYQPGNMVLGMSDRWVQTTHVFDKNGERIRYTVMVSTDGGANWRIWEKTENKYVYSKDSGDPNANSGDNGVSNDKIYETKTTVYARSGAIHIFTKDNATAQIFDLTGHLIKRLTVSPGENRVSVPSDGLYIVTVDNESFKVVVR